MRVAQAHCADPLDAWASTVKASPRMRIDRALLLFSHECEGAIAWQLRKAAASLLAAMRHELGRGIAACKSAALAHSVDARKKARRSTNTIGLLFGSRPHLEMGLHQPP